MSLQTYIAEGFMEDCEELIHSLTDTFEKVDWHKFCLYWKKMNFDILFYGRQSGPEVVEFTEELLQTARLYIVTETDNFEDQIIGLFIAYAITVIQPYKNLCALRLISKDVPVLLKIEDISRRDNRRDVLVILGKMYLYGKMQYHVSLRERAMDITIRKYFDGSTNVPPCIARRWHGRLDRHQERELRDLAQAEDDYTQLKMKAKLVAEEAFPDIKVKVDMFKPEAKHMADSLWKLTSGEGMSRVSRDDGESYVSTVKRRAMKKTVDSMRHLNSVADRQKPKDSITESPAPSTAKTKGKKLKSGTSSLPILEPPFQGFSLPSLEDPPHQRVRGESPEPPFLGFTTEEAKQCDYMKIRVATTNGHNKAKRISHSLLKQNDFTITRKNSKGRSPGCSKRKNNSSDDSRKKRRKLKNKLNKKLRLSNDFNSDDSNTFSDNISDEEAKKVEAEACKGKELTIQSKGVVKHFVDYEVSDIVIRTEKNAPQKDIEIEYIDNYTGANALYEEICEVSDDEEKDKTQDEASMSDTGTLDSVTSPDEGVKVTIEECDENGDTGHDLEVFQVVEDTTKSREASRINKAKNHVESFDSDDDETMQKILSKTTCNMERRKLKQPNLRSKLKKMGLLPVANFDVNSH